MTGNKSRKAGSHDLLIGQVNVILKRGPQSVFLSIADFLSFLSLAFTEVVNY